MGFFNNDPRARAVRDAIVVERTARPANHETARVPAADEVTPG